ncbi:MAG: hypothetical protein Q4A64_05615 [Porphyromonadaceae bacterium]|nr:hypothetical protein [Porphyromonadaceae bacterium]
MKQFFLIVLCALSITSFGAKHDSTRAKKVGIRDIFLMLPERDLEWGEFSVQKRKEMLKNIGTKAGAEPADGQCVDLCDERNGYLRAFYSYAEDFKYEVCYWNLKDGRKLVALSTTEGWSKLRFYIYDQGRLRADHSLAPNTAGVTVEDFYDTSRLTPKQRADLAKLFKERIVFRFELPRRGTSIEMHIGTKVQDMEYQTMFMDADLDDLMESKYVVFRWVKERWVNEVRPLPPTQ